jgi:hypothetical protein
LGTPLLAFSEYLNFPASYLANPATSFDPGKPESSPSETRFGPRHCRHVSHCSAGKTGRVAPLWAQRGALRRPFPSPSLEEDPG